jgi:hypothetical protein
LISLVPKKIDPPRGLGRGPAAEDGPDGDARARHAAEDAVDDRAVRAPVVAGREGDHRRQHERRADSLQNGPAGHERGHAPRRGGERRAARVDDDADLERPLAPPHVAELAAGQHQRGHDQRVERDHRLDRRDRGVEVLDQLGDGDVHHRLVQHHQELGRRKDDEDSPLLHRRPRSIAASLTRRAAVRLAPSG